jgi:hypothetical protein
MKKYIVIFGIAGLLATSGCAWYNITPIQKADTSKWGDKDSQDGYVFYQPELYFAATVTTSTATNTDKTTTTKQDISVAPLYLPNPAKAYRVTTHNFLAKADFAFNFENGWKLTSIADKSDNTTVATALAGQLQTVLKAAGVMGFDGGSTPAKVRVFLYKPNYDADGIINGFSPRGELVTGSGGKPDE